MPDCLCRRACTKLDQTARHTRVHTRARARRRHTLASSNAASVWLVCNSGGRRLLNIQAMRSSSSHEEHAALVEHNTRTQYLFVRVTEHRSYVKDHLRGCDCVSFFFSLHFFPLLFWSLRTPFKLRHVAVIFVSFRSPVSARSRELKFFPPSR